MIFFSLFLVLLTSQSGLVRLEQVHSLIQEMKHTQKSMSYSSLSCQSTHLKMSCIWFKTPLLFSQKAVCLHRHEEVLFVLPGGPIENFHQLLKGQVKPLFMRGYRNLLLFMQAGQNGRYVFQVNFRKRGSG